jgi:hypothetical protein
MTTSEQTTTTTIVIPGDVCAGVDKTGSMPPRVAKCEHLHMQSGTDPDECHADDPCVELEELGRHESCPFEDNPIRVTFEEQKQ